MNNLEINNLKRIRDIEEKLLDIKIQKKQDHDNGIVRKYIEEHPLIRELIYRKSLVNIEKINSSDEKS